MRQSESRSIDAALLTKEYEYKESLISEGEGSADGLCSPADQSENTEKCSTSVHFMEETENEEERKKREGYREEKVS